MLAAVASFSVVLVRRLNMFPVVACLFLLTLDYTWCFVKSQVNNMPWCFAPRHVVDLTLYPLWGTVVRGIPPVVRTHPQGTTMPKENER